MFQQRHLNELARVLRRERPQTPDEYKTWREIQRAIAAMCRFSNPNFKSEYFHKACGVIDEAFAPNVEPNKRASALLKLAAELHHQE